MLSNRLAAACSALALLLLAACGGPTAEKTGPVVLAAASLQEALDEAADAWASSGHPRPALSFAGSSALARQLESGAPGDLFVSADEAWMDELQRQGLLLDRTRVTLFGNALVLIAPRGRAPDVSLEAADSILGALHGGRLAMADPEAVPAGRYARAAFERFDVWGRLAPRVAPAENVRAALALVERGQSPLGVVYATDAQASDKVSVVVRFPEGSHPPIRYPGAVLRGSRHPDAEPFLDFLASAEARRIFSRHGFTEPR